MTKQTKYILLGAGGLILAGGGLVLAAVLVIGISIMAAQVDDEATTKNNVTTANSRIKSGKDDTTKSDKNDKRRTSGDETDDVSGTLEPELVGAWERSEGSTQIDATGKTQYGGGTSYTYEFQDNGAVKFSMREKLLTVMQCRITETKDAEGKAASDGDTLTIGLFETNHTRTNSCAASDDVDETLPAETVRLKYSLKTEYEITRLCIIEADSEHCYDRKN